MAPEILRDARLTEATSVDLKASACNLLVVFCKFPTSIARNSFRSFNELVFVVHRGNYYYNILFY